MFRNAFSAVGPVLGVLVVVLASTSAQVPSESESGSGSRLPSAQFTPVSTNGTWYTYQLWKADGTTKPTRSIRANNKEFGKNAAHAEGKPEPEAAHDGIHVASWKWAYVRQPFILTMFVVVAGLCKVGFHNAHILSSHLPESCLLVALGTILGAVVYYTGMEPHVPRFSPEVFFLFLLPPIMLESAYSLHDRAFFDNLGTILLYAVVGTLFSTFTIGPTLYALTVIGGMGYIDLSLIHALLFSALISAVDPVAVLAIFQEVGVNKDLYYLVFGESLLNDAVTVVLYNMLVTFTTMKSIAFDQILLGVVAFICSSVGGVTIGALYGVITSLVTKFTKDVRVVEPLAMLGMAYLSYLSAEMVHFSGIISIIVCGLVQMQYARKNISEKSYTTVKYFSKMISATCDCIIFLFLGMVLINDNHVWHVPFILWTAILCLLFRFIGVFLLTFFANRVFRSRNIGYKEQFIMAYGGLRGAVCFSLVIMLDKGQVPQKNLFTTTTLIIILLTVFIQGGTIKHLVALFAIKLDDSDTIDKNLSSEINVTLMDHVMAGVEQVIGKLGDFRIKQLLSYYDKKYIKPWLLRDINGWKGWTLYEKMVIDGSIASDHYAHLYGPATVLEESKKLKLYSDGDILDETLVEGMVDDQIEPTTVPVPQTVGRRESIMGLSLGMGKRVSLQQPEKEAIETLRKAFQENPYNRFHMRFNRNLVHDDDQELGEQLRRRRLRSRRLTCTAMSPNISIHSSASDISGDEGGGGGIGVGVGPVTGGVTLRPKFRRQPSSDPSSVSEFFLQRARQRRNTMNNMQRAKTIDHSGKSPLLGRKEGVDFPRLDPENRPFSTGDLEMGPVRKGLDPIVEMENGCVAVGLDEDRRPMSDPSVLISDERRPLMTVGSQPAAHGSSSTDGGGVGGGGGGGGGNGRPQKPPTPPKRCRKNRLSKGHPIDIDDDDEDSFESTV